MSVAYDTVGPSSLGTATTGTSLSWSHTCSGTNRLLVVSINVGAASDDVETTATYNGVSMTSAGRVASNNQIDGYTQLFYLVAPATGSNTVTVTSTLSKSLVGGSISFTGVDQTSPVSNITTNFGSGAAPVINVTSDYGNMVVDSLCAGSNINSSNQDLRWRDNVNTASGAGNGAQTTAPGQGTVNITYSISNDWWGIIAININASPVTTHPTLASTNTPASFVVSGTPRQATITTIPGDLLVIYAGGEDASDVITAPTGNSISFTLQASVSTASFASAYMWTGTDSVGGTWTLTLADPNNGKWGYNCLVFRNTQGVGAVNVTHNTGLPSLSLTTTSDSSAVVVFSDDWQALDGSSRTWQTVNNITPTAANLMELTYARGSTAYTAYAAYYPDAGTAGSKTLGLASGPTPQSYSIIALEILPPLILSAGISWFAVPIAPTLVAITHSNKNNITSIDIAIPSAAQAGDFLVLIVAQTSNAATVFNAITGWTKQGEQRAGGAAHTMAVFTRYHNGTDTFVTSSSTISENYTGQLRIYRGVDQTTPLDAAVAFDQVDPASFSGSAPSVSVVTPYSIIVTAYTVPTSVGVQYTPGDWTDPAGFTHEQQTCTTNSTNNAALGTFDKCATATGAQGPFSATITESRRWALATIVLRRA